MVMRMNNTVAYKGIESRPSRRGQDGMLRSQPISLSSIARLVVYILIWSHTSCEQVE